MKKLFCLFFLVGICGLGEGLIKEYVYLSNRLSWGDAQWYCRQNYSDLATFSNNEELQQVANIFGTHNDPVWIGLYRQTNNSAWQWSDGNTVSFSAWYPGLPGSVCFDITNEISLSYNWAYLFQGQWLNTHYWLGLPFYCYRNLILVTQNMTWNDALKFCATQYIGLASLPEHTQVLQANHEIMLTQTSSVWTGLRFVNGTWLWLSGESLVALPLNTASSSNCGAIDKQLKLNSQSCTNKLNFLCYAK